MVVVVVEVVEVATVVVELAVVVVVVMLVMVLMLTVLMFITHPVHILTPPGDSRGLLTLIVCWYFFTFFSSSALARLAWSTATSRSLMSCSSFFLMRRASCLPLDSASRLA